MVLNFYKIGQKIPEGALYIGRGNKRLGLPNSPWHNPFKVTEETPRGAASAKYEVFLEDQIKRGLVKLEDLAQLHGKDLVCYCAPLACHGHILEKKAAWAFDQLKDIRDTQDMEKPLKPVNRWVRSKK